MALVNQVAQEIISLFDDEAQAIAREVFQAIPGSIIRYLAKKDIVRKLSFQNNFAAEQVPMGTFKRVDFVDFERALQKTIQQSFDQNGLKEVRSEDLSREISKQYQDKVQSRALRGDRVSTIITLDASFQKKEGKYWTVVSAHVHGYIEEECEHNWFTEDKRKFKYDLTIELNGVAVNSTKALDFTELIRRSDINETIAYISQHHAITWDDL